MERSEREKMLAGQLYRPSDPELIEARIRARRLAASYNGSDAGAHEERRALLTKLFSQVGDNVVVEAPFHCDYGWNVSLEQNVYLNANCVLLDCAIISIGRGSQLGPAVQLCTVTHPVDPRERELGLELALPISIGANVWIGAAVVVGPGVSIGDDSVVGAGSVVLADVPAGVVAAGSPAQVVRPLS